MSSGLEMKIDAVRAKSLMANLSAVAERVSGASRGGNVSLLSSHVHFALRFALRCLLSAVFCVRVGCLLVDCDRIDERKSMNWMDWMDWIN